MANSGRDGRGAGGNLGIQTFDGVSVTGDSDALSAIGERSVSGTLAALLSLTSDAVLVFDGFGKVLLANDAASRLFMHREDIVGQDVRRFFPPAVGVVPDTPFEPSSLPFSADGRTASVLCANAEGMEATLLVRCRRVSAPGETYLLVAHEDDSESASVREHERLVEELSRANHRLSGTLRIVLETLDSEDVMTLFSRVLEEITDTMDAAGTVFYVAESDGYHLLGASDSLADARVPRFMSFGRTIERMASQTGHALRLRVMAPEGSELRRGRMARRRVVNEETREVYKVSATVLPPFVSFVAVPVWFGSHLIALIEVGWSQVRPTRREDAELLDAVAQYLSVQLAGAFSAMRTQREQRLRDASSRIREFLMSRRRVDGAAVGDALERAAETLDARCCMLHEDQGAPGSIRMATPSGSVMLDVDLGALEEGSGGSALGGGTRVHGSERVPEEDVVVVPVGEENPASAPITDALAGADVFVRGALVDVGVLSDERCFCLVLRDADAEPLDDLDLEFLRRVAGDCRSLARGAEARRTDERIAQALQTGMRNELQRVPGITADGIYSSATQAAVIGGDFYDLIRLPNDRACVIMGDVSGKGVEAASVSAAVKTALGAYSWQGLRPAEMVRLLNDFLLGFSRLETFATLFVGIVDLHAGTLTYCSAGHPPALLVRAGTGEIESLDVQSGVVGAFHEMDYQDGRVALGRGDVLLLYTDGTTEARATDGSFFGDDGLRDAVMREAPRGFDGLLSRLLDVLDHFTSRHLDDDVAMVALRFDGPGAARSGEAAPAEAPAGPAEK